MRATWWSGAIAFLLAAVLCAGCGAAASAGRPAAGGLPGDVSPVTSSAGESVSPGSGSSSSGPLSSGSSGAVSASGAPTPAAALALAGDIVGIDPGHNGGNFSDPAYL